ncbi:MAG: hypothetical protein RI894_248 [Bacteroidota bacterium]|jgi:hypothetical protein
MKQLIFLFALLLTAGFTYAQDKVAVSKEEMTLRKQLLVKFYGEEMDQHLAELTATEADLARLRWKTPISEQMYKINGLDQYGSTDQFVGQPAGLLFILSGQKVSIPADVYKSLSDFSREYLEKFKDLVKIID